MYILNIQINKYFKKKKIKIILIITKKNDKFNSDYIDLKKKIQKYKNNF